MLDYSAIVDDIRNDLLPGEGIVVAAKTPVSQFDFFIIIDRPEVSPNQINIFIPDYEGTPKMREIEDVVNALSEVVMNAKFDVQNYYVSPKDMEHMISENDNLVGTTPGYRSISWCKNQPTKVVGRMQPRRLHCAGGAHL